jgi:hypothetical protein
VRAEAGKGGSGSGRGTDATEAAAGRRTSHEAGENRGSGLVGRYGPAQRHSVVFYLLKIIQTGLN